MTPEAPKDTRHIDVAYVAKLARLHLSDVEVRLFQGQLDHILQHANSLTRLNVDGVEPTAHVVPLENVYREDKTRPGLDHDQVMRNAPKSRGGLFMVPKILE